MPDRARSSAGRVTVLLTSPRLPAGLLTGSAWRLLHQAPVVAAYDADTHLGRSLRAEGVTIEAWPDANAVSLLERARGAEVVWLAGDDGDEDMIRSLAAAVVQRSEAADGGPEVDVVVGSFDPVGARLLDLVEVMDRLRRECPWDRQQTHQSLVRYLVEETYETIEAIESADPDHLREELGDLLLQVMFHARLASERPDEPFAIDDVAAAIVEKLIRRHPHVFGTADADDAAAVETNWETIKAAEKSRASAMDGIPVGLPALSLASKVVDRTLKSTRSPSVPATTQTSYTAESLGDVLFALAAAAQAAGIDAEQALRARVAQEMADVRADEQRAGADDPSSRG